MEPIEYCGFQMDAGEFICVSPALAQLDQKIWGPDAADFNPYRFLDGRAETTNAIGHGALSSYLPFGAGRHRCIGEAFAYVQLKTIIATIVQIFDWKFPDGKVFPETDYTTLIAMPVKPVMVDYTRLKLSEVTGSNEVSTQKEE